MNRLKLFALLVAPSILAHAQIQIPEGTKVRVRLEQDLSSATAEEGQPVQPGDE